MYREVSKLMNEYKDIPLYGILLFTESHPHVIKMLKDADYFSALDTITDTNLALFSTVLFNGHYEFPEPTPGSLAMKVQIWREPHQNMKLLRWFDIDDSRALPLLVIWGYESDGFYFQKYSIEGEDSKDIYNNLNVVLSRISQSVQKAKSNNIVDKQKIFKQARWEIRKLEKHQKIKNFFETVSMFRGAIGI